MLVLKQPLIFPFLCNKSATNCQIDSNEVSKFKLKSDLCNCVKIEVLNLQLLHSSHTNGAQLFWDTLQFSKSFCIKKMI